MKKIKVLFVDHTPFAGGAQLVLADHIKELDKSRFTPIVACTDQVPELIDKYQQAGAEVEILDMPLLRKPNLGAVVSFIKAAASLRRLMKRRSIDIVVSNTTRASYLSSMAVLGTKIKLVWWVRDFLYPQLLFGLLKPIPSRIICVSKAIKQSYMAIDDSKGEVVYVASTLYQQLEKVDDQMTAALRQKWGIAADDVVVGFMGRLVREKGAEVLVRAMAELVDKHPKIKLLVVGTGAGQMHNIEPELKRLVEDRQLTDSIIFTGYQREEALYYSLFDIFVLATLDREPFATSVVQAMMAGNAVIGTNAGGTPEIIQDEVNGLLVKPGDVEDMAGRIQQLIEDPKLRQTLAKNGQTHVLQYHREEVITDQVESIYLQLLHGSA